MAKKRMFSLKIVDTDEFLDMPPTTQNLYFHLCMRADDDGFVSNPKKIMKVVNAATDDIKVLIGKKFVIPFDSGVCVIKHWKIHNLIRQDRYTETEYKDEKNLLIEQDKKYQLVNGKQIVIPIGNQSPTVGMHRLGKVRLDKNSKDIATSGVAGLNLLIEKFKQVNPSYERLFSNKTQRAALERLVKKHGREKIENMIDYLPKIFGKPYAPVIFTPYQLENKLGQLISFIKKNVNKGIQPEWRQCSDYRRRI